MGTISNAEFLESYLAKPPSERMGEAALLPLDVYLMGTKISELETRSEQLIEERMEIARKCGDTGHDDAFNENNRGLLKLSGEMAKIWEYLDSQLVDYPKKKEHRVTLGSRVNLRLREAEVILDVVGFSPVYSHRDLEPLAVSLEAPIIREIMGHAVGHVALMRLGDRQQEAETEILEIDQSALLQKGESYIS